MAKYYDYTDPDNIGGSSENVLADLQPLYSRITELQALSEDWDGEEACVISESVAEHARTLFRLLVKHNVIEVIHPDNISPGVNGTIIINLHNQETSKIIIALEIGATKANVWTSFPSQKTVSIGKINFANISEENLEMIIEQFRKYHVFNKPK